MKSIFLIIPVIFINILTLKAQSQKEFNLNRNSVYCELLGTGVFFSLNYDRIYNLNDAGDVKLTTRIGIFPYKSKNHAFLRFPTHLGLLIGRTHNFEVGLNYSSGWYWTKQLSNWLYTDDFISYKYEGFFFPYLGYRIQPPYKRILFRATVSVYKEVSFTPYNNSLSSDINLIAPPRVDFNTSLSFWPGISFGYNF